MTQDPQSNLSAILRETGESLLLTSEYVQQNVDEYTLQGPLEDELQDFFSVVCKAEDKDFWAPQGYGIRDYLLFSTVTELGISKSQDSLGNEKLLPVLFLLGGQEFRDDGEVMEVTLGEGIIDSTFTYNKTTSTYHLWYMVHGWTARSVSNTQNQNDTTLFTASKAYDRGEAVPFDIDDWWVVSQRNLTISEIPCAAKVLLHTVGTKFSLTQDEGDTTESYLTVRDPQMVAYWPFDCISSSSRSSARPASSRASKSAISKSSVSRSEVSKSKSKESAALKSSESLSQSLSSVSVSRKSSAVSKGSASRVSISQSSPSGCIPLTGCIDIICDVSWNSETCDLDKVRGTLILEAGVICDTSGCNQGPCNDPLLGLSAGFRKFWADEMIRGAMLVPDLISPEVKRWVGAIVRGSVDAKWTNIITDGRIDSEFFDELTALGIKVHTIPHQVSESERRNYLGSVISGASGGIETLVFWTREDCSFLDSVSVPKIGYHTGRFNPPSEAEFLVTGSQSILRSLTEKDRERARLIRTGVDAPSFVSRLGRDIAREHWALSQTEHVILAPEKIGPHTKDCIRVLGSLPQNWSMVLLTDGGMPEDIHEMAFSEFPDRVKFIPRTNRLGDYLPAADVLLWSREADHVPEEIIAAWMNRVPVATVLGGEVRVLGEDRRPFFWAIPRSMDPGKVAEIVLETLDVQKSNVQVERAHRMVWNDLNFANTAVAWENLIHDVVKEWWG